MFLLVGWNLQRPAESCFEGLTIHAYWIPVEGYRDMWNGVVVTLDGPKTRSLVDENGLKIADVSEVTYRKCKEEGACYLQQVDHLGLGLLVAYLRGVNVFRVLDRTTVPFGIGAWNNRLEPFISVATSDFSAGTKLQVKELAGVRFPNGDLHNGCVRVDDVNSDSCSIRLFVGFYDYYSILHSVLSGRIHAEVSTGCEILKYIP